MPEGDYRDELAAAHARIDELERRLADAETGNAGPWLAELQTKRASILAESLKGLGNPKTRWRAIGIVAAVALALATTFSIVYGTPLFFLIFGFLTLHPGALFIFGLGRARNQQAKLKIAAIDEKIADVKRMATMMGPPRVRVADTDPRRRVANAVDETVADDDEPNRARR